MIEPLTDLPAGVIGFEAVGEVEAADYRDVLIPAMNEAADRHEMRLVYVLGERFTGYEPSGVWADAKLGVHLHGWERTALVTDLGWASHLSALFGWMVPGEFRHFPLAERQAAIAWAAS